MKVSKQKSHSYVLLFFYLSIVTSQAFVHNFFETQQEDGKVDDHVTIEISPNIESNPLASNNNIIGMEMEECDNEDEECLKRSISDQAHLDYIYTQQSRP
ncbi:putative phytosulfokines 6 isoform X2 [Impatiens glandulifera]|uniref:putative phytosulfokines 6 isoform X2 n=1 Tax=Impatiens glandulifera TaxID=253017 RepID=UPI001FB07BC4|nr:putative phytosulfokines 6 isoform X2 [Impatiens glandulifera]